MVLPGWLRNEDPSLHLCYKEIQNKYVNFQTFIGLDDLVKRLSNLNSNEKPLNSLASLFFKRFQNKTFDTAFRWLFFHNSNKNSPMAVFCPTAGLPCAHDALDRESSCISFLDISSTTINFSNRRYLTFVLSPLSLYSKVVVVCLLLTVCCKTFRVSS